MEGKKLESRDLSMQALLEKSQHVAEVTSDDEETECIRGERNMIVLSETRTMADATIAQFCSVAFFSLLGAKGHFTEHA